jgi:hypothetical protein
MKSVGKPDAGNRHVRFDERGEETERCRTAQVTAPLLDSTVRDGIADFSVREMGKHESVQDLKSSKIP